MKELIAVTIIIASLFISGFSPAPQKPKVEEPKKEAKDVLETRTAAESINAFAFDLYAQLKDGEGNIFCSPYSISTALTMAYAGASSETAAQMEKVLHLDTTREVHSAFSSLINYINSPKKEDSYRLTTANALWGQKGYAIQQSFVNILKNQYSSELNTLDLKKRPEDSRNKINKWVEDKTNKNIKDLIQKGAIDSLTRLILTNAIYFKAAWEEQFKNEATKDAPFYLTADKKINVPMMRQKENFKYYENKEIQLLELPYLRHELSMFIILPRKVDGLKDVEKILTSKILNSWLEKTDREEVIVLMPKFKTTSTLNLNNVLTSMGMSDAFSLPPADFSGITGDKDLYISSVIHKAYVDVNEKGTEAAAATAVLFALTAAPGSPPKPKIFRADHPFMFLIRENRSGAILFMGRLINPSEKSKTEKAEYIGTTTMEKDGTIKLFLRAEEEGIVGHGLLTYSPDDPDYTDVLEHLGGLSPGESKSVRPWPDE